MTVLLNEVKIQPEKFPNNETHLSMPEIFYGSMNRITLYFEGDHDLVTLFFVRKHIANEQCMLYMPYMPYSRMDRRIGDDVFTLKHVADLINSLDFATVWIDEPHSDVTAALINNVHVLSSVRTMLPKVEKMIDFDKAEDFLVFPDAGAEKRYSDLEGYNVLVGSKHRNPNTGKIESLILNGEGDYVDFLDRYRSVPEGMKALILDDLCSYGGTFALANEALRKRGFDYVGLIVAHCEKNIYKGGLVRTPAHTDKVTLIDKVFTTSSLLGETSENSKIHVFQEWEIP